MDPQAIRVLIQAKIQDGRLPRRSIRRVCSSPSTGEKCDACETIVSMDQLVMEGTTQAPVLNLCLDENADSLRVHDGLTYGDDRNKSPTCED